jgi:hypothetical protein
MAPKASIWLRSKSIHAEGRRGGHPRGANKAITGRGRTVNRSSAARGALETPYRFLRTTPTSLGYIVMFFRHDDAVT